MESLGASTPSTVCLPRSYYHERSHALSRQNQTRDMAMRRQHAVSGRTGSQCPQSRSCSSAKQPRATRACQGSSRAGCTASDATASCAGVLLMLQAMIDKPARNSTRATMASSRPSLQPNVMTSAENKGSGVATSVAMPSPPEPSSHASMEASSDKRTREAPDTTTKPL